MTKLCLRNLKHRFVCVCMCIPARADHSYVSVVFVAHAQMCPSPPLQYPLVCGCALSLLVHRFLIASSWLLHCSLIASSSLLPLPRAKCLRLVILALARSLPVVTPAAVMAALTSASLRIEIFRLARPIGFTSSGGWPLRRWYRAVLL